MLDIVDLQAALHIWVATATDLPPQNCIWANQHAPQPSLPYLTLKLSPFRKVPGQDAKTTVYDGTQPAGSEIVETITGNREFTLTLEAFSSSVTGAAMALAYLEAALIALSLTDQVDTLLASGISIVDWDTPIDVSALIATAFQSRATVDVRFTTADQVTGNYGYIAQADVGVTIKAAGNTIDSTTIDLTVD